jgi:hypothetical protein
VPAHYITQTEVGVKALYNFLSTES